MTYEHFKTAFVNICRVNQMDVEDLFSRYGRIMRADLKSRSDVSFCMPLWLSCSLRREGTMVLVGVLIASSEEVTVPAIVCWPCYTSVA